MILGNGGDFHWFGGGDGLSVDDLKKMEATIQLQSKAIKKDV